MSRFIDKLNQVSQAAQPIGFRPTPSAPGKPRMQLVASLAQADVDNLAGQLAGADAGLLRISEPGSMIKALEGMCQTAADIPWGGWLEGVGSEGVKQAVEAGADFVVFSAATSLAVLQGDEVGKVLEVETSLSEGLLAAVNNLPVDVVLIAGQSEGYSLTWQNLMLFQYFADSLTKPLLVTIPPEITARELQVLWEAGVSGVVVELIGEPPEGILAALRQKIDELTLTLRRRNGKTKALLPQIGGEADITTEDDD